MAKPRYVASPSELAEMKRNASENRQILRQMEEERYGAGGRGDGADKEALRKEANRYEKMADDFSPRKLRGGDKDKLAKRAEELREKMSEGMPTYSEMNDMRKNPSAPYKNLAWEKRNAENTQEYKQIMRRLEPGDPGAASIERFRRSK